MKSVKLYPEQARAETLTLLAEFQVGCNEPAGNRRSREMIVCDRMRLIDPLGTSRPRSSVDILDAARRHRLEA